ncbi:hypothetical protein BN1708_019224, partial [Verticillium longisporum]
LVDNIKTLFVNLYGEQLKKPGTSIVDCDKFDNYFDQQIKELEGTTAKPDVHARDQGLLPQQEEAASGNFGDEPPLPPGLHYRGMLARGPDPWPNRHPKMQ